MRNFFVTLALLPGRSVLIALLMLMLGAQSVSAGPVKTGAEPPKPSEVLMIGDRLIDVAYNLGFVPAAMSARGSMWPLARELGGQSSRLLGCPNCVIKKKPTAIPDAVKELGIKRIVVEKSPVFCLYKPKVSPENVVRHLDKTGAIETMNVTVEYVDFSDSLASAIRQTGALLGRKGAAETLIRRYEEQLATAKSRLPENDPAASVVVFNGVYQQGTGKAFVRVEVPGGYTDRFLLSPLGLKNVGGDFVAKGKKPEKGHVILRKLDGLVSAAPDVIVVTGDADAFQRLLAREAKRLPRLKSVPALQNSAVYSLPRYVDSAVVEYPQVLQRWATALAKP